MVAAAHRACPGALLAVVAFAGAAHAQRTWTVARDRLADFTDIPPAIAAASPGDAIRVWPDPQGYSGFLVDKGIAVLGVAAPGPVQVRGEIRLWGVPASQHAVVANFETLELSAGAFGGFPVVCAGCRGPVHLQRISTPGSRHGPALSIHGCDHVTVADCTFTAGATWDSILRNSPLGSGPAFAISGGQVAMLRSRCYGGHITNSSLQVFASHMAGTLHASRLLLADSAIHGGGGFYGTYCQAIVYGTDALTATASLLAVTGTSSAILGGVLNGGWTCYTYRARGVVNDAQTVVHVAGDVPGANVHSTGQIAPAILPWLASTNAPPGGALDVTLRSAVPGAFATLVSVGAARLPLFEPVGIWIDLSAWALVDAGVVSGARTIQLQAPPLYPFGMPLVFQSALLSGSLVAPSLPAVSVLH